MCKLCVFAGTTEGRQLIERLQGRGADITACTATEYGAELLQGIQGVAIHSGRMDEEEMARFFEAERFSLVVDATHPYADRVTDNIARACEATHTDYLRLERAGEAEEADGVFTPDATACAAFLKTTEGGVFLTTGSKELPAFCEDAGLRARLFVRVLPMLSSLQICAGCGLPADRIIAMQGPFDEDINLAMFKKSGAKYMVTKDTGAAGGYGAKVRAAQKLGMTVVVIGRPPQAKGAGILETCALVEKKLGLSPRKKKVFLIGCGMGNEDTRTLAMERAIREAECLIGAKRMLSSVDCGGKETFPAILSGDIEKIIRDSDHSVFAVLLSGDTGFYSGAKKLIGALSDMDVRALPGVGSLSYFCARLGRPWEDVRAVSLHGRSCDLAGEVRRHGAVFALLGGDNDAKAVLSGLCRAGLGDTRAYVGERLGYPDERVSRGAAADLAQGEYDPLSVLLVENDGARNWVVTHGLPDEAFLRDDTPMTKSEVRSVCLSKLRLTENAVVYDVGSGSGSVSVEAAIQAHGGQVYAIEKKPEAAALTRKNAEKFGLSNLILVEGSAPEAMADLPAPTHAFIGGSSGNMREIIDALLQKNPRVRMVATAVTLETISELSQIAGEFSECDIAEVAVSKPRKLGRYRLMTAQNPVYIFTLQNGGDA